MSDRMKRTLAVVTAAVMLPFLFCGCNKEQEPPNRDVKREESKIQIGMSFDSFVIERWQRDRDIFVEAAKDLGAEVNVQNASGDLQTQISQIEYFIDKKVDAIVIIAIDSYGLSDVVAKAKDADIKVIAYDRLIMNANVDLYISFDNEMVGIMMANALIENGLESKKVLMLGGPTTDNNVSFVEAGFCKVMQENEVTIVDSVHAEGWKAESAASYIYQNPDMVTQVDAIMCGNDNIATQTIRALAETRLAGKIKVVGQDADLEACQRIVEDTQVMTVYKPVEILAKQAADDAIRMISGESLKNTQRIDDGTYQVPYVALEPIAVTKENMDEVIIGSGFHQREDVYLNVMTK